MPVFFHTFLVDVEGEEYVVSIDANYGLMSVTARNSSKHYMAMEFEPVEIS